MQNKKKILRITTVSSSLNGLLKGQLKFLNNYFEVVGIASGKDGLNKVSAREGIRCINVNMSRDINLVCDISSLFKLIKVIYKEKPDIVHANTPKASLLSMTAAWICRAPHRIYTVTGLRFETTTGKLRKTLICMEKITCKLATKVIPEGEGVKKTLIKNKITNKPLKVVLHGNINGIDINHFTQKKISQLDLKEYKLKLDIDNDSFVFIFVGRLVRDKGINELVDAFTELNKRYKNTKLLLVGPEERELDPLEEKTIKNISDNKDIIAVGRQEDVRPFFAISDCLAFPSYREGFPNVVLQAGAMGLPSIVSDINGCNEIIIDGINGLIIPPKDKEALLEKMIYSLETKDQHLREMTDRSREMVVNRYKQTDVWNALLDEYNNLINNNNV